MDLVPLVTHRPSAYGPLLRRMGGLDTLLDHVELDLDAAAGGAGVKKAIGRTDSQASRVDDSTDPDGVQSQRPPLAVRRSLITYADAEYPPQLKALFDPPPALFVAGVRSAHEVKRLATLPLVAVVGTRTPSSYGREMAAGIARGLAEAGVRVVSGLALGIDALAHRAALQATSAPLPTVAVMGCGADVAYPRTNQRLYEEIVARGLVVSEYPWGTTTRPWRFPARNRIVAGLSLAVVIVEGAADSGSLITAEHALDLGRPVFAVPGEAGRRLSTAPHSLLRSGAHLCESASDVLSVLGLEAGGLAWSGGEPATPGGSAAPTGSADADWCRALLRALDEGEADADTLARRVGGPTPAIIAALGILEVEGFVGTTGARYRLVRGRGRKE